MLKKIELSKAFIPQVMVQGDNCSLWRIIGNDSVKFSPIIYLDRVKDKLPKGYPDHPHRGFETVTYYTKGKGYHEDDLGYKDVIYQNDVMHMCMGKGCVHAEMPGQYESLTEGFQLWINLPKKLKYSEPEYNLYRKDNIPVLDTINGKIKVLGGNLLGTNLIGPLNVKNEKFYYYDIEINKDKEIDIDIHKNTNGVIFVYEGNINVNSQDLFYEQGTTYSSDNSNQSVTIKSKENSKLIIVGGTPIKEKIVYDFLHVLNSEEELKQTLEDVIERKNGFERWKNWQSRIKDLKYEEIFKSFNDKH